MATGPGTETRPCPNHKCGAVAEDVAEKKQKKSEKELAPHATSLFTLPSLMTELSVRNLLATLT